MGFLLPHDKKEQVPQVVLVPPLFERDHRGRSRMAKSSYDYQFCKPQLRWLFNDYLWPCATSLLRFSPAEDRRVSVKARLGTSLNDFGADSHGTKLRCTLMTLQSSFCHTTCFPVAQPGTDSNGTRSVRFTSYQLSISVEQYAACCSGSFDLHHIV